MDSGAPQAKANGAPLPPAATAFFQGNTRASAADDDEIEVLECNWPAVQVYLACQWTVGAGMEQVVFFGIAAQEVLAALHLLGIRRAHWADIKRRIQIMVATARPLLNKKKA